MRQNPEAKASEKLWKSLWGPDTHSCVGAWHHWIWPQQRTLHQKTTTETLGLDTTSENINLMHVDMNLHTYRQTMCYRSAAVSGPGWAQAGERWRVEVALQLGCAGWDGPGWFPLLQLRSTQFRIISHLCKLKGRFTQIVKQTYYFST